MTQNINTTVKAKATASLEKEVKQELKKKDKSIAKVIAESAKEDK